MREAMLRTNEQHRNLLSKDLGALAGLLFEVGSNRLVVEGNAELTLPTLPALNLPPIQGRSVATCTAAFDGALAGDSTRAMRGVTAAALAWASATASTPFSSVKVMVSDSAAARMRSVWRLMAAPSLGTAGLRCRTHPFNRRAARPASAGAISRSGARPAQ